MKRFSYFLLKLSIIIFTLHCSIFTVNCCYAQKVAVVLSGGGTKGLAHIGVLKALEENHIPIDYIAGTSIGAVVAGLYASGYSPDSIEKIFMSDEVVKWVRGDIDEKYIYYFKMPDPNASWASIRFDYNKGWIYNLPTNLISPVMMDFAFNEIFSGADAEADYKFDSLFVPFRCVASDISDNKPFIFRYGDLGQAIRASMTVPFLFSPIKVNGKLMFDGGMYDNFPADVVYKDFNPDYIIGSQVTHPEEIPKENDIMSQIYSMLMNKSSYSAICDNSIIIKPDVPHSYSLIYFDQRQQYIDSGYTATIRALKSIRLAVTAKSSPSDIMAKRKAFNKKKPPLLIDSIFISGVNKNQQKYILKSLHYSSLESSPSSSKITLDDFKKNYFRLISDERIEHIATRLKYNKETGYYDMYLDVTKQKRFTAQFGGLVSSNPVNEAFIGLQYNTLSADAFGANVNSYFGKFYNSVEGNARLDLPSRLPLFLEASSSYSQWDYFNTSSYFVTDKTPSYLFQYDTHSELNIGIPLSNKGKLELGAEYAQLTSEYYQTNNFSRLDTADQNTFDLVSVDLLFERNSLNFKQFPNSGTRFYSELRYVSGTETNYPGSIPKDKQILSDYHHWFQYHLSYENYFKTFGDLKLGYYTELHLSNQDNFNNYTASILAAPAFQPTPDSKTGFNPNYRAYNYGGAGIKSIYMFTRSLDIRVEAYIFQPYKEILSDNNMDAIAGKPFQKHYYIGMAALVFQTPIGPLSLSLNYYDKSNLYEDRFSVVVSFGYVIFNRRALD